ncbi:MAG: hypothetical protein ABI605_00370 [Rhizobacter sp.]
MIEKFFAIVVFAICMVLMLRLLLGVRLRLKFDAVARNGWHRIRGWAWSISHWRARRDAARAADEAIQRASDGGTWEGNVYKPKSFKRPPRNKLH